MTIKRLLAKIALPLLCVFFTQIAFSQTKVITGKVLDDKGNPVQGATVTVKGTKGGTSTDAAGAFSLNVPATAKTLVVSSVGFGQQEVKIGDQTSFSVSLVSSSTSLSDVVVVGYGTRKIKDATGSVASLSAKDFNKGVIASPEELLQGRTPGVVVTPSSGEPGAAININIRGTSSISANNRPLFVVDGVPLDGGGTVSGAIFMDGGSSSKDPLSFLNPNDIENISILKDASSAAIYGSRGANGVVIITTKSGRGKGHFTFGATTSASTPAKRYDLLKAGDFVKGVKQANIDAGTDPQTAATAVAAIDKGASTDWQDQIFRTGISQGYNLSWGISQKSTALRLSGSYDNQQGIVKKTDLKRLSGRINLTQKFLSDKLKFEGTLAYSNIKNQYGAITNSAGYQGSLISTAIAFNPTYPIFNADGSYFDPGDGNRNPVEVLNYFSDNDNINRLLTNLSGSYEIIKGLTYKFTYGYDHSSVLRKGFADPRLGSNAYGGTLGFAGFNINNSGIFGNGRAQYSHLALTSTLIEHTLTYDKSFGKSQLNFVGGFSYQKTTNRFYFEQAYGLTTPVVAPTDPFIKDINNFVNHLPISGDSSEYELQSYFGRINYSLSDKYFITLTVRTDGSSKFASGNKYATFPALAVKWKLLNESFATGLGKVFSDFSLRGNYGITGNQDPIQPYASLARQQTYINPTNGDTVTTPLSNSNPNLKWEQTATAGVGLDWAIGGRLKGTVDYYHRSTKDLLFFASYPQPAASANRWVNLPGQVLNTGLEFSFDYKLIQSHGGSFGWDISYNMTFMKNKVVDFGQNQVITGAVDGQGLSGAYAQTIVNGHSLFTWQLPVFLRFDGNGDGVYANGSQNAYVGSALPTFAAGLTNNFSFKQWNASIFFNTVRGFNEYNNTANAYFLKGSLKTAHNVTYATLRNGEDPINPGSVSTRFLEKGDFIRLSNASLSYSFLVKPKMLIKSLNLALSGQNLLLITKYSGLDPEVNVDHSQVGTGTVPSRGFDYAGYPKARTVTLGLNVGF